MRRRIPLTVAIALVTLVASASPAAAHAVAGVSATNFKTTLRWVRPTVPGVTVRVIETGSRLELANTTDREIVVLGYNDEPYLRVGPDGVFENRRSPATYINATRAGTGTVPGSADPKARPVWHKVSGGHTARWHDHRIHWMGNQDPPQVRRASDRRHVIVPTWTVTMKQGDRSIVAAGSLVWVPGPKPLPLLLAAAALFTLALAAGLSRRWAPLLATLLAVLVLADVVHALGIAGAATGGVGSQLAALLTGSFFSFFAWAAAAAGLVLLARRQVEGLFFAAFAGVAVALAGGLADAMDLVRSQVPFAWGADLARALVATSIGLGLGVAAGSVVAILRHRGALAADGDPPVAVATPAA